MNNTAPKIQEFEKTTDQDGWRWYGPYPSVTTILSNTIANKKLESWFKRTDEKKIEQVSNAATKLGSDLHDLYWKILNKQPVEYINEQTEMLLQSFKHWVKDHGVEPLHTEAVVYSEKLGFAGTLDFLGKIDGKLVVADWKNSNRYSITYGLQLGAYRIAAREIGLADDNVGLMGVQIDKKTADVKIFQYEHYDWVEHKFLCVLEAFKAVYFHKLKKINYRWLMERAV